MTLWYVARAAGLVAVIAFTAATALGALASSRTTQPSDARSLDARFLRQMAHRSSAVVGLGALALHVVLLILDAYVDVSIPGALIPFTSGYRPLAIGLGTISVALFVVVALSGALRGRLATSAAAARRWRRVHLLAYVGWGLAMTHGVLAGTDSGATWTTAIYVVCGLSVVAAFGTRLLSARRDRTRPLAMTRTSPELVRSIR
ncbi:MAG: hypothetical protein JWP10_815 [Nocardioidaceae bacterium]|nr:hypothetical protein [Nocardioidaceae bacterium]